ncbi:nucleoside phosphatase family-domain-containing protein [Mycena galericulata]|nr:nucleoside phosphatase family-domain-containing protein [Mycena galericulata]
MFLSSIPSYISFRIADEDIPTSSHSSRIDDALQDFALLGPVFFFGAPSPRHTSHGRHDAPSPPAQVHSRSGQGDLGRADSQAADILAAVSAHLRNAYPFPTARADTPPYTPAFAVLDLGGASTQIVFEPEWGALLHEGEHKYELEFGGRSGVHRLVDFMSTLHEWLAPPAGAEALVSNACLARGTRRTIELAESGGAMREVAMDGGDVGGFDACARLVALVLAKDAVCAVRPCAFGGVYQPALSEAFPAHAGRVLLLSYFYDRVAPLMLKAEEDTEPVKATVCAGRDEWLPELEARPEWCLDLTFIHELLQTGYEFDGSQEVMFGKKIAGTELGWCLGTGIKLVGGGYPVPGIAFLFVDVETP